VNGGTAGAWSTKFGIDVGVLGKERAPKPSAHILEGGGGRKTKRSMIRGTTEISGRREKKIVDGRSPVGMDLIRKGKKPYSGTQLERRKRKKQGQ